MNERDRQPAWYRTNTRWADARDLGYLVYVPVAALVAWFVPEPYWDACCSLAARVRASVRARWFARRRVSIAGCLGWDPASQDARAIVLELTANQHRARLQILRCHRRPVWQPPLEVVGIQHVEDALRSGRGVIVWLAPFIFDSLLTKMAFHRAGFALGHLSRRGHGLSETRLGSRIFNPVWTSIEDRYLAERLTMRPAGSTDALRALVERVRRNQIASVTLGSQSQQTVAAQFLAGTIRLAASVPGLAVRLGVAVLPVFTVRERDGRFVTTVEAPLRVHPEATEDPVRPLVDQAVTRLESWVRRYPAQFNAWDDASAEIAGHTDDPRTA